MYILPISRYEEGEMSRTGDRSSTPRAVIHKKILNAAESDPNASMAQIADGIAGASTELVERVLEQYGDPAGDVPNVQGSVHADEQKGSDEFGEQERREDVDQVGKGDEPPEVEDGQDMDTEDNEDGREESSARDEHESEGEPRTEENGRSDEGYAELSDKQLRVLRLIEQRPEASQGDLAGEFDVTRATISRWLNDIEGFEWPRRREHARRLLNGDGITESDRRVEGKEPAPRRSAAEMGESGGPDADDIESFGQRLDAIEERLGRLESGNETGMGTGTVDLDPELAHKVVHACIRSDQVTQEEELRLLKTLMS